MSDELTVPETLELLRRHGIGGVHVWSPTYGMPPNPGAAGWELVEHAGIGWDLRWCERGRPITRETSFRSEPEACAALLRAVLAEPGQDTEHPTAYDELRLRWRHTPWRREPSSRFALARELGALGVPRTGYSLYGGGRAGLCLEERESDWRVFHRRDGRRDGESRHVDEADASREFWRRFVDDVLPELLGAHPGEPIQPPTPSASIAADDMTLAEALAIFERRGRPPSVGIHSASHGVELPGWDSDLHERSDGRWELTYSERGQTNVVGEYAREGDACAAITAAPLPSDARFASAARSRLASAHANTRYEQLLYLWRLRPWRFRPIDRAALARALRDYGFPSMSYNLSGGRGHDVLTLEERLDHWRVYQVIDAQRVAGTTHTSEPDACAEFWRRAVDEVLPDTVLNDAFSP